MGKKIPVKVKDFNVEVGDLHEGEGAELFMDERGIRVQTDYDNSTTTIDWDVWAAIVEQAAFYRAKLMEG